MVLLLKLLLVFYGIVSVYRCSISVDIHTATVTVRLSVIVTLLSAAILYYASMIGCFFRNHYKKENFYKKVCSVVNFFFGRNISLTSCFVAFMKLSLTSSQWEFKELSFKNTKNIHIDLHTGSYN